MFGRRRALEAFDEADVLCREENGRKSFFFENFSPNLYNLLTKIVNQFVDSPQAKTNEKLKLLVASDCRIFRYFIDELTVVGPDVDKLLVDLIISTLHCRKRLGR